MLKYIRLVLRVWCIYAPNMLLMYSAAAAPTPPSMLELSAYIWTEALFALLYVTVASSFWRINVLNMGIQDGWRQVGQMVSMSPALRLWDCNGLWSGDLYLFIAREALWICGCSGCSGGSDACWLSLTGWLSANQGAKVLGEQVYASETKLAYALSPQCFHSLRSQEPNLTKRVS